jgi:membrane-associated phospholipid phosphatase
MSLRSILELDARLSRQMRVAEKPGALRSLAAFFAHSGDSWFWGAALIILWFISDSFWREWEVVEFVGISLLAALVMGIKFLVRRRRPEGEWGGIYRNTDPHSFPSGHAARAFLIAVIGAALGPLHGLESSFGSGRRSLRWRASRWVCITFRMWLPERRWGWRFALIGLQIYEPIFSWFTGLIGFPLW